MATVKDVGLLKFLILRGIIKLLLFLWNTQQAGKKKAE